MQRAAGEAGRDPSTLQPGVFATRPDTENLDRLRDLGTSWATFMLPPLDRDAALGALGALDDLSPLLAVYHA